MTEIHTNKVVAFQKQKRNTTSQKSLRAIESGDIQAVIDSLSDQQRRFVEEYLVDLNLTEAAKRAGYSAKTASKVGFQLKENQAVRIAIDALRAQRAKNSDVTKDFVLKGIERTIRNAEEAGNHAATLRGYELLARHLGMFVEKTEISGPDGKAIEMKQKVEEDVADFTSAIASIAKRSGKAGGAS